MKRGSGFTLIEMLVVIAIVLVLAATLFSVYEEAHRKALKANCQQTMSRLLCAARLYAADYDGCLPSDFDSMNWADDDFFWNWKEYSCPAWVAVNNKGRGYGINRLVNRMTLKQSVTGALAFIWDGSDVVVIPEHETLDHHLAYSRHSPSGKRRVNMGFLDGRVEWRRAETISTELFAP